MKNTIDINNDESKETLSAQVAEDASFLREDVSTLSPADIVAYNELRSCADLYRMYESGNLNIRPHFQRDEVWSNSSKTRFIDSLIKGLPIPSMCFSLDYNTEKWQVIDGLQRMSTIIDFLGNKEWQLSVLEDVDQKISGKKVKEFQTPNTELYKFFTRVQNLTIPITVLRCDYTKENHTQFLFTTFHRLNSEGMRLTNQEVRNCIYSGSFNDFLFGCSKEIQWIRLNKIKPDKSYRFRYQEIILRFFAFLEDGGSYTGHLAKFLNTYMNNHKKASDKELDEKRTIFNRTVAVIYEKISDSKSLPKISIALLEALMVGIASNIEHLEKTGKSVIQKYYENIKNDINFSEANLREGLSSKEKVISRLSVAKKIFSTKS